MTGKQLKLWRESADLTLRELCAVLGHEMDHTTLSRWERLDLDVPIWVAEKLMQQTRVELPLGELTALIDEAGRLNVPFRQLLREVILAYLSKSQPSNIHPLPAPPHLSAVAEPAADYLIPGVAEAALATK